MNKSAPGDMPATELGHRLSEHFALREAVKSQTATRAGIDNRPPTELLPRLSTVAERILEPVRAHFGVPISPSSWYRCQDLERALKRKPASWTSASQHAKGEAVDFEVPGVRNIDLARWIEAELDFDQLILEFFDPADPAAGWVHCSYVVESANRRDVLTFDGNAYTPGLPRF